MPTSNFVDFAALSCAVLFAKNHQKCSVMLDGLFLVMGLPGMSCYWANNSVFFYQELI